jgi:spore coat protein CotH
MVSERIFFWTILFCLSTSTAIAQADRSWMVFSDTAVARVDITVDPALLQWIYANVDSDSEHYAQLRFRNQWIDDTVDSIGFRLRGNTSRDAKKKSLKVSFNTFIKGRKFYGVEKLNFNGEHNDPSIVRSKLSFDLFRDAGITASRANHARVYINGQYYGLYISVEHIDEEFIAKNFADDGGSLWKCLYPADLKYLGSDPNLYKNLLNEGRPAYELAQDNSGGDFGSLAKFIAILNLTPDNAFPDSIEKYLDVRRVLQYFAMNTLIGSWDDYRSLMNNYYLYHIPSENKFTLIPYDYDNTFGVDWFNINWSTANPYNFPKVAAGSRPLSERLLANNQYRDLFTRFLEFYRERVTLLPLWEQRIDRIKDSITAAAVEDTFRTLDYGFTVNDFHHSFSSSSYQNKHVKFGLKQFVNARNASLPAQIGYNNALPVAYDYRIMPLRPAAGDSIRLTASCFGSNGIKSVSIQYLREGMPPQTVPMIFSPVAQTKKVEDADRWTGVLPPLGPGASMTVRIVVQDSADQTQSFPRHAPVTIRSIGQSTSIVINEFMADNKSIADPSGEFDDWIELYNPADTSVVLTGKYLTDKQDNLKKWKFTQPGLSLGPGEYLLIWCDEQQAQPGIHANFKLSADGEFIALTDEDGITVIDSISFGPQSSSASFGRSPSGSAQWTAMQPTPGTVNMIINSAADPAVMPSDFSLIAFPNPFNPSVTIRYSVPNAGEATLTIHDMLGREVWRMIDQKKSPGTSSVQWEGNNAAAGVYLLTIRTGNRIATMKLLLVK